MNVTPTVAAMFAGVALAAFAGLYGYAVGSEESSRVAPSASVDRRVFVHVQDTDRWQDCVCTPRGPKVDRRAQP